MAGCWVGMSVSRLTEKVGHLREEEVSEWIDHLGRGDRGYCASVEQRGSNSKELVAALRGKNIAMIVATARAGGTSHSPHKSERSLRGACFLEIISSIGL